jgi:hypothetical protein
MTKPFPDFTLYLKVGIEGLEDQEIYQTLTFAYDEDLTSDQNGAVLVANAQLAQVRLQSGLQKLMNQKLIPYLQQRAEEEGIDFDPRFFEQ